MVFQTFVFFFFNNLLHFKEADGESWGASSIWVLIEGKKDKRRDKEKKIRCVCVCMRAYVRACERERVEGLK